MRLKSIPPVKTDEIDDDWERPLSEEESCRRMHRVSGQCVCDICGYEYWQHPDETRCLSAIDDQPFMVRLCNGWLGKL